jgi:hypothetical protein
LAFKRLKIPKIGKLSLKEVYEGLLMTPNQFFFKQYMCSPGCYLFIPYHLRLKSFIGYRKIDPDVAHLYAYFANFGAFWPFESP